jgi:uncharacterized membrane protein
MREKIMKNVRKKVLKKWCHVRREWKKRIETYKHYDDDETRYRVLFFLLFCFIAVCLLIVCLYAFLYILFFLPSIMTHLCTERTNIVILSFMFVVSKSAWTMNLKITEPIRAVATCRSVVSYFTHELIFLLIVWFSCV